MKPYFILGTDTDCGKTYVTCQLVKHLKKQQQTVLAIKPVASGLIHQNGQMINEDVHRLTQSNGVFFRDICPWRLTLPISPHLAARAEGISISARAVADFCCDEAFNAFDYLLIEGAGGLIVPINEQETWIDVLSMTNIPVILVVGMRLGCINHALLTELALKAHNIRCCGWVANCIDPDMKALSENINTLSNKLECPLLLSIPFEGEWRDESVNLFI